MSDHNVSGWAWSCIGDLGEVSGGLTKNSSRSGLSNQLPYLRVANVYANELRLDDISQLGVKDTELKRVLLKKGDLLVVEGNGSIDQIGRVAEWQGQITPCTHQNHLIKIRPFTPDGRFILYWLLSADGRDEIVRVASSTSGLHTLSLSKVRCFLTPWCPLPEQY